MAWMKWSDTSAEHPNFARLYDLEYFTPGLKRELVGFIFECAAHSALHFTDYLIEEGVVKRAGGMESDPAGYFASNWEKMLDACQRTGFFTATYKKGGRLAYKMLEDADGFVHLIRKDEADWNKGREKDLNDTQLKGKVRLRDGDQCRWCGVIVNFDARTGGRAGTYDHANSQVVANGDPAKMYVSCRTCNQKRGDGKNWNIKLRPAPVNPYYSPSTVEQLASWGFIVEPTTPPLFDGEIAPNSDETPRVEPETSVPQVETAERPVPSSTWTPVDPAAVETKAVEPETSAPAQTPVATAPVDDQWQMIRRFEQDLAEGAVDDAPAFVHEAVEAPTQPSESPLGPETSALTRNALPETYRNLQEKTEAKSGRPGITGTGRDGKEPNPSTTKPSEKNSSPTKPRRRRRRRRPNAKKD